jgi:nucleoside-diphosphate-sugar epimerase
MESYTERILITGALGQIGTELTNRLVEIHGAENVVASGLTDGRKELLLQVIMKEWMLPIRN